MDNQTAPLTMADLKAKVDNYRAFATKAMAPEDVFVSAVFHRDAIDHVFANAPDATGVQIYSIKNSATDDPQDISYMMVPVKEENGTFTNQIADGHPLMESPAMMAMAVDCMSPLCK